MARTWTGIETWLAVGVVGVGLALTALAAVPVYMSATTQTLHPTVADVPSQAAAEPAAPWRPAVGRAREVVKAHMVDRSLPGLSVAVAVDGEMAWAEGFGWADVETRLPVTPRTRFRIGTASIVLTSAAVGRLVEQGRLQLDAPVHDLVPEFPAQPPVTLRQVMAHVAGIRTDGGDESPLFGVHCERPVDAFPDFAERELLAPPGTLYRYSRYGWIVVSAAVEAAAGQPFGEVVRDAVIRPLGLDDTTLERADGTARASSYFPRFATDTRYGLDPMRDVDLSCYAGAGAYLSTPTDLVRLVVGLHAGGVMQAPTLAALQAEQHLASGAGTGYGLGWDLEDDGAPDQRRVGHDGDLMGGTVASVWRFPPGRVVVAVASNTSYADTEALARRVADAFDHR